MQPDFYETVRDGDIIVAEEHFGCGSGRENTAEVIRTVGIVSVVAESFARIFYRNAIAIGLPVVTCCGVSEHVSEDDVIDIDLADGVVRNATTGEAFEFESLQAEIRSILDVGGWNGYLDGGRTSLRDE
ncbi:3-isopropylmalate dehydratase (plasmid) [Salinigranum rubrum]|uniref:3-isopropylmalate dehydratase n=1 Tax=Salinigranum rubrum TaxID=755307 RepID=A0A2I8VRU5_9EURY|nr:3-isopropylmalate dehydratase [Salinigranum rubrum]